MPLAKKDLQDPVFKTNKNQNSKGKEFIMFGRVGLVLGAGLVLLALFIFYAEGFAAKGFVSWEFAGSLSFGFVALIVSFFSYVMGMLKNH